MPTIAEIIRPLDVDKLNECLVYSPESGLLYWKPRTGKYSSKFNAEYAGRVALNCVSGEGYLVGRLYGQCIAAHRAAYAIYHGRSPKLLIDHINRVKTDNRICNLREVTTSENNFNKDRRQSRASVGDFA